MPQQPALRVRLAACPPHRPSRACTTPASSTTRAVCPSWWTCTAVRSHRMVQLGLQSLCNLDHRGATNAEPNVGDGAGILIQVPDRFLREVVGLRAPAGRRLRHRHRLPPPVRRGAGGRQDRHREDRRRRGPAGARLAGGPRRQRHDRPAGPRRRAHLRAGVHHGRGRSARAVGPRARSALLRAAQAHRARARAGRRGRLLPEPLRPHPRLQGHAHLPPGGRLLRRPGRRAGRDLPRPRPLPVLHQHVPVVAARPPVPPGRPQRRDQHGDGQRELDARPRGAAPERPHRGPRSSLPHLHPGELRHRPLRRGARAPAPRRLLAPPRRAHDDPRGLGAPRVDARLEARLLPLPRQRDGAVGRSCVDRVHRRHA